jgi:hypothetical protein
LLIKLQEEEIVVLERQMCLRLRNRRKRTGEERIVDENDVVAMTLTNFTALNKWSKGCRP